jgi:hypothetical protein
LRVVKIRFLHELRDFEVQQGAKRVPRLCRRWLVLDFLNKVRPECIIRMKGCTFPTSGMVLDLDVILLRLTTQQSLNALGASVFHARCLIVLKTSCTQCDRNLCVGTSGVDDDWEVSMGNTLDICMGVSGRVQGLRLLPSPKRRCCSCRLSGYQLNKQGAPKGSNRDGPAKGGSVGTGNTLSKSTINTRVKLHLPLPSPACTCKGALETSALLWVVKALKAVAVLHSLPA